MRISDWSSAVCSADLLDHFDPLKGIAHIQVSIDRPLTERLRDIRAELVEHVREHDACAILDQSPRLRRALTARSTGDDGDLVLQIRHYRAPSSIRSGRDRKSTRLNSSH